MDERKMVGERVELRGNPIGVTLAARTGTIARADVWDGYWIVRLDAPARGEDGAELRELREAADNLRLAVGR
jgi:hypothetical protein